MTAEEPQPGEPPSASGNGPLPNVPQQPDRWTATEPKRPDAGEVFDQEADSSTFADFLVSIGRLPSPAPGTDGDTTSSADQQGDEREEFGERRASFETETRGEPAAVAERADAAAGAGADDAGDGSGDQRPGDEKEFGRSAAPAGAKAADPWGGAAHPAETESGTVTASTGAVPETSTTDDAADAPAPQTRAESTAHPTPSTKSPGPDVGERYQGASASAQTAAPHRPTPDATSGAASAPNSTPQQADRDTSAPCPEEPEPPRSASLSEHTPSAASHAAASPDAADLPEAAPGPEATSAPDDPHEADDPAPYATAETTGSTTVDAAKTTTTTHRNEPAEATPATDAGLPDAPDEPDGPQAPATSLAQPEPHEPDLARPNRSSATHHADVDLPSLDAHADATGPISAATNPPSSDSAPTSPEESPVGSRFGLDRRPPRTAPTGTAPAPESAPERADGPPLPDDESHAEPASGTPHTPDDATLPHASPQAAEDAELSDDAPEFIRSSAAEEPPADAAPGPLQTPPTDAPKPTAYRPSIPHQERGQDPDPWSSHAPEGSAPGQHAAAPPPTVEPPPPATERNPPQPPPAAPALPRRRPGAGPAPHRDLPGRPEAAGHGGEPVLDLACVGGGPFTLSLCALADELSELRTASFEQQRAFRWHPGLLIEGATLQVPFLADLVTLADPANPWSFLRYLRERERLFPFYFAERFHIDRTEYDAYCRWVSDGLAARAAGRPGTGPHYGHRVDSVHWNAERALFELEFTRLDGTAETTTGEQRPTLDRGSGPATGRVAARNIALGIGTEPYVPESLRPLAESPSVPVFHSAEYLKQRERLLAAEHITVVGSGQSGAEVFLDLLRHRPAGHEGLHWLTRSPAFAPMEYSKLGLEHFTPDYTHYFHGLSEETRDALLPRQWQLHKAVDAETLAAVHDELYRRTLHGSWPDVVLTPGVGIRTAGRLGTAHLELHLVHAEQHERGRLLTDAVVLATGYRERPTDELLAPLEEHLARDTAGRPEITTDYRLRLDREITGAVFVQNGERHTHGVGAPDLGLAAHRSATILNSLTGREHFPLPSRTAFTSFGLREPAPGTPTTRAPGRLGDVRALPAPTPGG